MTPAVAAYTARIASFVKDKDPLAVQTSTPATIRALFAGVPQQRLAHSAAPGKWSALEIMAHLAEAECANSWRYRQMLESPGSPLAAYNQEKWAALGGYSSWTFEDAFDLFRLLRQNNLHLFARLTPAEWESYGTHSERGRMTVRDLVLQIAGHDLNHIEQMRTLVNG